MATIDISRFSHGLQAMLAPTISDGQTFVAYLEENNSFTIQADNILALSGGNSGGNNLDEKKVQAIAQTVASLETQTNELLALCRDIPALQVLISNLDSEEQATPASISEFNYSSLSEQVNSLYTDVSDLKTLSSQLSSQVEQMNLSVSGLEASLDETLENTNSLKANVYELQGLVAELKSS